VCGGWEKYDVKRKTNGIAIRKVDKRGLDKNMRKMQEKRKRRTCLQNVDVVRACRESSLGGCERERDRERDRWTNGRTGCLGTLHAKWPK
jgi:hypothetical protein